MAKRYIVTLTVEERETLQTMTSSGTERARKLTGARILLKADEGWQDQDIRKALDVGIATIERARRRFVLEGLDAALNQRPPNREYSRKLDGEQEAHLIALACSSPPEGRARWSLCLLADKVVQLKIVDSVSHETIQVLKDNELKPGLKKEGCIPPKANAEFVYHMEDVLDVYKQPADPRRPLVCFDETPEQLVSETRHPLPIKPGQPERYDYEYCREGTAATVASGRAWPLGSGCCSASWNWMPVPIWRSRRMRRVGGGWPNCWRNGPDRSLTAKARHDIIEVNVNINRSSTVACRHGVGS